MEAVCPNTGQHGFSLLTKYEHSTKKLLTGRSADGNAAEVAIVVDRSGYQEYPSYQEGLGRGAIRSRFRVAFSCTGHRCGTLVVAEQGEQSGISGQNCVDLRLYLPLPLGGWDDTRSAEDGRCSSGVEF